jgi:hypothetical protein
MFSFYFLMDQGVVRLTLRALGLVKTILLKTFVDHFYGKDKKGFFFFFFNRGITFADHPMAWRGANVGFLNPVVGMAAGCAMWVVAAWECWSLRAGAGCWMLHKFHCWAKHGSSVGWAWCWWLGVGWAGVSSRDGGRLCTVGHRWARHGAGWT